MDDLQVKNDKRRLIITSTVIIIILLLVGFGVLRLFYYAYENTMKDRMIDEVYRYESQIESQINQDFEMMNTIAAFFGSAENITDEEYFKIIQNVDEENDFVTLGVFDTQGKGLISDRDAHKVYDLSIDDLPEEVKYVINRSIKGEEVMSDGFVGILSEKDVVMFWVPIYSGDSILGCTIASAEISAFSGAVEDNNVLFGSGSMSLIDSKGNFLIRGVDSKVDNQNTSILFQSKESNLSEDEIEDIIGSMANREQIEFSFTTNGEKYNVLLFPLKYNDWYLLCANSFSQSSKGLFRLELTLFLFFLIIISTFSILLIRWFKTMKKGNEKLYKIAYYDQLTGAYTMSRFSYLANEVIKSCSNYAICVLDIRQFKFINEIYGKEQADQLLCSMSTTLMQAFGIKGIVARGNGDTFYVFLKNQEKTILDKELKQVLNDILTEERFSKLSYPPEFYCGVAFGNKDQKLQTTITNAMFALARAKQKHMEIWYFDKELHELEQTENYVEIRAQDALNKNEFKLYLQPKIYLKDGYLSGAEALVRWVNEDNKKLYPSVFIPIFERNRFCIKLDFYMFERVCEQIRSWLDKGYSPIPISVNQSKLTFFENGYVEKLSSILNKYKIDASLITLEILEGLSLENADELNQRIDELKKVGFHISMDDFGTGYSSLNTLGKLNVDEIKIDRGLLLEATSSKTNKYRVIMEEIVRLTKKLCISTVVEGVETNQDDAFVKHLGCEQGQGYYYNCPVSAEEFTNTILLKAIQNNKVYSEKVKSVMINNISISSMDEILQNAKIGIWAIEISKEKENKPRMYANENMLDLLGLEHSINPERLYEFWFKRIDLPYLTYIENAIKLLMDGKKAEVEYLWNHPKMGWIYVRCGGYLESQTDVRYRIEGYHQISVDDVSANTIFDSEKYVLYDRLRLNNYSSYYMDIYDQFCEIDPETRKIHWIFQLKGKYLSTEENDYFDSFVNQRLHPFDVDSVLSSFEEIVNGKNKDKVIEVRMLNSDKTFSWVRLIFVSSSFNLKQTILMGVIDIQNEKQALHSQKDRESVLSIVAEENRYIYDVNLEEQSVTVLKGLENQDKVITLEQFIDNGKKLCNEFVDKDSILDFISFKHLKKVYDHKEFVSIDIQKQTDEFNQFIHGWYRISLATSSALANRVLVLVKGIEEDEVLSPILHQYIKKNFESICYVDGNADTFSQFTTTSENRKMLFSPNLSFSQACNKFIDDYVVYEQKEQLKVLLDINHILSRLRKEGHYTIDVCLNDQNNNFYHKTIYFYVYDLTNNVILMMISDTTDSYLEKEQEQKMIAELKDKATLDSLTGLYNRYYCQASILDYLNHEGQDKQSAFLLIDLDNFKLLNDTLGHRVGDQALMEVAHVLKSYFRETDIVSRFGGDEFVVLMKNIKNVDVLGSLMERLLNTLDMEFTKGEHRIHVQASIGIALAPKDGLDLDKLYEKADKALYQVKKQGKNNYAIYQVEDINTL